VEAKLSQDFDDAPRSKHGHDNSEAWRNAAEYGALRSRAKALARRALEKEARLADKHQKRMTNSECSVPVHAGERNLAASPI
jgi:hypothetical protein